MMFGLVLIGTIAGLGSGGYAFFALDLAFWKVLAIASGTGNFVILGGLLTAAWEDAGSSPVGFGAGAQSEA